MKKPQKSEYKPAYQKYIDLVQPGNFIELLDENTENTISFFASIDTNKGNHRYAEDKWTIKEVFMHMIDTERGFSYRAIVCVRNDDKTPLYSMDENFYANNVDVANRSMASLIEEFIAVRESFKLIYTNNMNVKFSFLGNGVGHKISARAIGYIAIGHVLHHCSVIRDLYIA